MASFPWNSGSGARLAQLCHEIAHSKRLIVASNRDVKSNQIPEITFDAGDEVNVTAENSPVRFLLISGRPIGEPVAWYGPMVMNPQEELGIDSEEYQSGTFLKHG